MGRKINRNTYRKELLAISKKIEVAIESKGMTKTQFGALMKVDSSIVTAWLSGANMQLITMLRIEKILDIKLVNVD